MAKKYKTNPNDGVLDLDYENMDSTTQQEQGPVTVLGKTFANDDERRAYFREQLRAKLPELRNIEGFPIGSDDNIINLSDPPYYTACPNPWLNDFIAEWEQEKIQLEADGIRQANIVVNEPYASDVSEGKNNPVYSAHPYHTKVPHPAIMRFILYYTQPGDIVFDGFAGTGMTGVAAAACNDSTSDVAERISSDWIKEFGYSPNWGLRHAICGDLSPYAANISSIYNSPIDINLLKSEITRIKQELVNECGWLYKTTDRSGHPNADVNFMLWSDLMICPFCGEEYIYWDNGISMDGGRVTALDTFPCPHCGGIQSKRTAKLSIESYFDEGIGKVVNRVKQVPVIVVGKSGSEKIQRGPNQYDFDLLQKIEEYHIPYWYPTTMLPEGLKTKDPKSREVFHVHQFFTKRTLIALSCLYNKIESSPAAPILRFFFTSLLNLISKRNRVQAKNPYSRGQGVLALTLVLPPLPTEASLLEMIDMRLNSIIKAIEAIPQGHFNAQYVSSADDLLVAENSVDYIFTDPPFGANINYSELNSMHEPWLKVMTNNSHEAIVNEYQDKTEQSYRDTMFRCFSEYYRILKPGKWMTVEFSNTSAAVWNSIQNALQRAGFVIANVAALDKKQGGMNANMTTTAVKQDLAISCYKPSSKVTSDSFFAEPNSMWDFIDEHLAHLSIFKLQDNKSSIVIERDKRILYDRLVSFYVQRGFTVPINSSEFQQGLRDRYAERDGMYFTASQAAKYDELRKRTTGFQASLFFVDSEQGGIAWLNNELSEPQTYQDLQPKWMQAINGLRKGDILPELMQILEENFIKESDGKWRKPNLQDDVDLAALRHKSLIREFKVYVEVARKPRGKIKEARVDALRAGFKQCYQDKDFATIVAVGDRIPQNLLTEDEQLLQFYEIASSRV